jgi:hypothetical protein
MRGLSGTSGEIVACLGPVVNLPQQTQAFPRPKGTARFPFLELANPAQRECQRPVGGADLPCLKGIGNSHLEEARACRIGRSGRSRAGRCNQAGQGGQALSGEAGTTGRNPTSAIQARGTWLAKTAQRMPVASLLNEPPRTTPPCLRPHPGGWSPEGRRGSPHHTSRCIITRRFRACSGFYRSWS